MIGGQATRAGSHHLYKCYKGQKKNPSRYHEKCNKQLLIIGRASAFREFDESDYSEFYRKYLELANLIHPGKEPTTSPEAFQQKFAGWTMLSWRNVAFGNVYEDVLVPKELRWDINFPSSMATVVYAGTGDLLLARSNPDGFFIVERVLCRGRSGDCGHPKGIFDAKTGSELDFNLDRIDGGKRILVESYDPS